MFLSIATRSPKVIPDTVPEKTCTLLASVICKLTGAGVLDAGIGGAVSGSFNFCCLPFPLLVVVLALSVGGNSSGSIQYLL